MAITGAHVLLYSPEAAALRAVLSDVIGWESVDAGEGWLIFALPPAELGVHPLLLNAEKLRRYGSGKRRNRPLKSWITDGGSQEPRVRKRFR